MSNTVYDKIQALQLRGDWGKSNITSLDALHGIIDELCERLEKAHQLFQDLDEELEVGYEMLHPAIEEGLDLTDIVQDYPPPGHPTRDRDGSNG